MKSDRLIVQKPTGRCDSIGMQLTQLLWNRGPMPLFKEDTPFSFSTGLHFSHYLLKFFTEYFQKSGRHYAHIYDMGAGLGLLSKHILEVMNNDEPDMAQKVAYHVSDYSKSMVDHIHHQGLLKAFNHQVTLDVMAVTSPLFKEDAPPHIMMLIHVLNALPSRHYEVEDGRIYELLVETSIPNNAVMLDPTVFPPTVIDSEGIKDLLLGATTERKTTLLPLLTERLEESWSWVPLQESTASDEEKRLIEDFVDSLESSSKLRFNFSLAAYQAIHRLLDAAHDDAMLIIYDCGYTRFESLYSFTDLVSDYDGCLLMPVFFPIIAWIAKEKGFHYNVTQYPKGTSQIALLTRGLDAQHVDQFFEKVTLEEVSHKLQKTIHTIKNIKLDDPNFIEIVTRELASISKYERQDHLLRLTIATECHKREFIDPAIDYCQTIMKDYGPMSVSSLLLLAKIYQKKEQYKKAEECLYEGIEWLPYYARLHYQLSLVYGKSGQAQPFIDAAINCLKYTDKSNGYIWNHFITIAIFYYQLHQKQQAKEVLLWVGIINDQYPTLIPEVIVKKAQALLTQYFK